MPVWMLKIDNSLFVQLLVYHNNHCIYLNVRADFNNQQTFRYQRGITRIENIMVY